MAVHYGMKDDLQESDLETSKPRRPVLPAMLRGAANKCMNCGHRGVLTGFLSVNHACSKCGEEFHHQRADDAPPYFTITIVGHIIIPALLVVEVLWRPEIWIHMAIWPLLTVLLALVLMRPIKGALIGLQWALYMHGFDPESEDDFLQATEATESTP